MDALSFAVALFTPSPWHITMPSGGGVHSIAYVRMSRRAKRSLSAMRTILWSGSSTSGMRSSTSATFARGWSASASAFTRRKPVSWSSGGSRLRTVAVAGRAGRKHSGVRQFCEAWRGSGWPSFPEVVESIALNGAPQSDDVVGAPDAPVHSAVLQAPTDDRLASPLDHAG